MQATRTRVLMVLSATTATVTAGSAPYPVPGRQRTDSDPAAPRWASRVAAIVADDGRHACGLRCVVDRVHGPGQAARRVAGSRPDIVLVCPGAAATPSEQVELRDIAVAVPVIVLAAPGVPGRAPQPDEVAGATQLDLEGLDHRALHLAMSHAMERHRLTRELRAAWSARGSAPGEDARAARPLQGGEAILRRLEDAIADAVAYGRPLSVCVAGVDAYERIAAERGVACAEAVVEHLAGLVAQRLRGNDRVGRIGPGELLVVLPGMREEFAMTAVRRVQCALRLDPYDGAGQRRRLHFTVSFGIAALTGLESAVDVAHHARAAMEDGRGVRRGDASIARPAAGGGAASAAATVSRIPLRTGACR